MKRGFKILSLIIVLALSVSLAACRVGSFNNGNGAENYSQVFDENVNIPESYGKRYAVESVDLNVASSSGVTLQAAEAVDKVYESGVTIRAGVSGGTQLGSGTIVDIDVAYKNKSIDTSSFVYVLTCHHVIEGSAQIAVYIPKLIDAETDEYDYYEYGFAAMLMGGDKKSDIAVLRIEITGHDGISASNVKKAQICSEDLQIGDDIFLLGNPAGTHPGSYSKGSVSRSFVKVSVEDIGTMKLMQTDAAANHGNSGGGVYNFAGQLVGVLNSGLSIDSSGEPLQGLSFFIPVTGDEGVESVVSSLVGTVRDDNYGYVAGRWMLGATLQQAMGGIIQVTELSQSDTLYTCGIAKGDFVFEISYSVGSETYRCEMTSISEFSTFFEEMQSRLTIGDTFTVKYSNSVRGTNMITAEATVTQHIYTI